MINIFATQLWLLSLPWTKVTIYSMFIQLGVFFLSIEINFFAASGKPVFWTLTCIKLEGDISV